MRNQNATGKSRRLVLAGLVMVAAATGGCTRVKQNQGYLVDETLLTSIQPGVDNRDSVAKTLGRPSFAGEFDGDRSWYYVSRDTRQLAFGRPW